MFKQSRVFFSAMMIAFLLVSTLILSNSVSAKSRKCPVELPKTLLSLYLTSDLVVIADLKNESVSKNEDGDENGYYADIKRDLDVSKTFKGQKSAEVSFVKSEYRQNVKQGENAANEDKVVYLYDGEMMSDQLKIGNRYLFFLTKNEDTGEFYATDYRIAGREITLDNSGVYEKRLNELGKIIAGKKNQLSNLAEWLVDLTEDEATRWDGAAVLSRSFSSLRYESGESETEEVKPTLDEDFNEYSSAIAKQITEAQKDRLSNVFITSLNQSLLSSEKDVDYDYEFAELVGNWDRARLAMYGYSILLAIDKSDVEKTRRSMNFVANITGDSTLSSIFYEYTEIQREEENEIDTEADKDLPVIQAETPINSTETEIRVEKVVEKSEINESAKTENSEPEDEIMTEAQVREQIFQKFNNRYQEILARNFVPEIETDIAENIEETNK